MPTMAVNDMNGAKVGDVQLSDEWFAAPRHHDLIHQALVTVDRKRKQQAGRTKTRSEIKLTTAKWYRQKGTGRARHGARSAPLFVGGSKAHGPRGQRRRVKLPKKMRRKALQSALSAQVTDGCVVIIDEIMVDEIRTKTIVEMLQALDCEGHVLILLSEDEYLDQYIYCSSRNIPGLVTREVPHFSIRDVLWADHIIVTSQALAEMGAGGEIDAIA